ncbi:MAG: CBS domain-containing protein [Candidatus Micrarchaeia archaeon]
MDDLINKYNVPEELISKTEFYNIKTPITKVLQDIEKYDAIIVKKDNKYVGVVDSRALYKHIQDSLKIDKKESLENLLIRVPKITDATTIEDVAYYFYKARVKALPYIKNDKIRGILKRSTLLKILLSLKKFNELKVENTMTSPIITIEKDANILQAIKLMKTNRINRLIVVDNRGNIEGILTSYSLIKQFIKPEERLPEFKTKVFNLSNFKVKDFIEPNLITVNISTNLDEAVRKLIENDISSIVVVDKNKPVGILTELDAIVSMLSRSTAFRNKIFISGLNEDTYQFEDEIREELKNFIEKVEKLRGENVEFISIHIKKLKTKTYEIHARLELRKEGIITMNVSGYLFDRTFDSLLDVLWKEILKKRDINRKKSKEMANQHEEE